MEINDGSAIGFWQECKENIKVVKSDIAKSEAQPQGTNYCYIISIKARNILPGMVSIAPIKLAAQRITESTHRLCTDQEVRAYENHQKNQARYMQQLEIARKGTVNFDIGVKANA